MKTNTSSGPATRPTLFGIALRWPGTDEPTWASLLAVGLWLAAGGLIYRTTGHFDRFDAGGLLLVIEWACVAARIGIRPDLGLRHVAVHAAGAVTLACLYTAVCQWW